MEAAAGIELATAVSQTSLGFDLFAGWNCALSLILLAAVFTAGGLYYKNKRKNTDLYAGLYSYLPVGIDDFTGQNSFAQPCSAYEDAFMQDDFQDDALMHYSSSHAGYSTNHRYAFV
eukprot:GDKI01049666.1.p2 GENE.GDKI01049666.1~~GDKI01049666.1.p2  ORF type:complete len:117 (-),score=22.07 GDKI01049666.1:372-722(-)